MSMTNAELLARQIEDTREWTRRLIADLREEDWFHQPAPGLAHPLWLCGHLAVSQDVLIHTRCLDRPALDESFSAHFPIGVPVRSPEEHDYPAAESVLDAMETLHTRTLEAVGAMSDALLAEPAWGKDGQQHPHYVDKMGAVSHCARHEAFHAGQLATIRRLLGKPFLR